jgi:RNA polymerase sigma-B factor
MATPDTTALFEEFARTGRRRTRNRIVEEHMGLAVHIAKRYNVRAGRDDDIEQVAMLALVKAVDRFDPSVGVPFAAFAGRTIEGEIKRHFRDATWSIKVPRGAKELHLSVRRAGEELSSKLGRSPSVAEVAARRVESIDPSAGDEGGVSSARQRATSTRDVGFVDVENESVVEQLLQTLPDREREIVRLRFYEEMSQVDIAEIVGVSQMHVSRLLKRAFRELREAYGEVAGDAEFDGDVDADEVGDQAGDQASDERGGERRDEAE